MIKVHCRTNIDNYKNEVWPGSFCCRPLKGDKVMSENGHQLAIVDITHVRNVDLKTGRPVPEDGMHNHYSSILIIELHHYYPGLDTCRAK